MSTSPPPKPILLYDGECDFCSRGVSRWRRQMAVEVFPVQGGEGVPFGLPPDKSMGAIHLIDSSGEVLRGAAAVFRMMDRCGDIGGGMLWKLYRGSGWFRAVSDRVYALVAARRAKLSEICSKGKCRVGES